MTRAARVILIRPLMTEKSMRQKEEQNTVAFRVRPDAYKVEIHPRGSVFAPNGMPGYHIYWQNDDGGPPTYEKDSALTFEPPADGEYLVGAHRFRFGFDREDTSLSSVTQSSG